MVVYLYIYLAIGVMVGLHPVAVKDVLGIYKDMTASPSHYRTVMSKYGMVGLVITVIISIIVWPVNLYGIIRRGK